MVMIHPLSMRITNDVVDLEFDEDPVDEAFECISSLSICEAPSPPVGGAGWHSKTRSRAGSGEAATGRGCYSF